jgi:antirestriction protein
VKVLERRGKMKNDEFQICIQNLRKYNAGKLVFEWVKLSDGFEAILKTMERVCGEDEYMIADWCLPFDISEYMSLEELKLITQTADFQESEIEALTYFLKHHNCEISEAMEKVQKGDFSYVYAKDYNGCNPAENLAQALIFEIYGGVENLGRETLERYFDFEAFGRDLMFDYTETNDGNFICAD